MHERREKAKDGKDVQLREEQELRRVHVIPVAQFMRKNCLHFPRLTLLDKRIEDYDVLALRLGSASDPFGKCIKTMISEHTQGRP